MAKDIVSGQFVKFRFQKISLTPTFHQIHEKTRSKSTSASKIMLDSVLEIVFPTSLLKFCLLTPNALFVTMAEARQETNPRYNNDGPQAVCTAKQLVQPDRYISFFQEVM